MNFHKVDLKVYTAESERRFAETPMPTSCSAEEKVFRSILNDAGRHHILCGYVRIPAALPPMLCDPSSLREISAVPMTPSSLPSSCWTGIYNGSFPRKRKTSGGSSDRVTNPKRYLSLLSKLGSKRSSPPPNILIASRKKRTPVRRQLHKPSISSSLPVPPNTIEHSESLWGTITMWTPHAGCSTREAWLRP